MSNTNTAQRIRDYLVTKGGSTPGTDVFLGPWDEQGEAVTAGYCVEVQQPGGPYLLALTASDEQLEALRIEAGAAGDRNTVRDCTAGLDGDALARARCAAVIADAEMRAESDVDAWAALEDAAGCAGLVGPDAGDAARVGWSVVKGYAPR